MGDDEIRLSVDDIRLLQKGLNSIIPSEMMGMLLAGVLAIVQEDDEERRKAIYHSLKRAFDDPSNESLDDRITLLSAKLVHIKDQTISWLADEAMKNLSRDKESKE